MSTHHRWLEVTRLIIEFEEEKRGEEESTRDLIFPGTSGRSGEDHRRRGCWRRGGPLATCSARETKCLLDSRRGARGRVLSPEASIRLDLDLRSFLDLTLLCWIRKEIGGQILRFLFGLSN